MDLDVIALARRFEPVLRFTKGELFLPMSVADYVSGCALYRRQRGAREPDLLVPQGQLNLDRLVAESRANAGAALELHFAGDPLERREYRRWLRRPDRTPFRGASRFAVVGLLGRLVDALMRLTLIVRGKVPGGFAAAAEIRYRESGAAARPTYYVHASRDGGYLVLQYWFCYAMNDWRSTFSGVNDHEADWEQITLFLTDPQDGEPQLAWVAFSSHDEVGDDLRRRVDDPDLTLVDGTHPVVYAGAGSHSGAYLPGDYIVSVAPPALDRWVRRFRRVKESLMPWTRGHAVGGIGIPFIDYRRGDGPAVGPGTDRPWHAVAIDDKTPWVYEYRGLWGFDTRDPLGGERAPAGPRYERNARVRPSWERPVAWAGLDKQPPTPAAAEAALRQRAATIAAEQAQTQSRLADEVAVLRAAFEGQRAAAAQGVRVRSDVEAAQATVDATRDRLGALRAEQEAVAHAIQSPPPQDGVHAHLRHRAVPDVDAGKPVNWLLRVWSTVSVSILLLGLAAVIYFDLERLFVGAVAVVVVVMAVDATVRGHLWGFLGGLLVLGVVAGAVLLLASNARLGTALLLAVGAVALLLSNLGAYLRSR